MVIFVTFTRPWYLRKRFIIPICVLSTMFILATILGSVLGTRSKINVTSTIFYLLFLFPERMTVQFASADCLVAHTLKDTETSSS